MNSLRASQAALGSLEPMANSIRATTLRRPLRSLCQHANMRASYTTKTYYLPISADFRRASLKNKLDERRTLSCNNSPSSRSITTKIPQAVARGRASYSTEATAAGEPTIHAVFETKTGTWQYVVADPSTLAAVIIDPVLDYDPASQAVTTFAADSLLSLVKEKGYKIDRILETHAHADHLTAASYLQSRLTQEHGHKPSIGIGKRIGQVQKLFGRRYAVPPDEYSVVFDTLFDDDEKFKIGNLVATAMHLPGHTPDHLGYKIGGKGLNTTTPEFQIC